LEAKEVPLMEEFFYGEERWCIKVFYHAHPSCVNSVKRMIDISPGCQRCNSAMELL
ncbi:hypothetical protein PanWU01x14_259390, partial [Parasponia andersonii]